MCQQWQSSLLLKNSPSVKGLLGLGKELVNTNKASVALAVLVGFVKCDCWAFKANFNSWILDIAVISWLTSMCPHEGAGHPWQIPLCTHYSTQNYNDVKKKKRDKPYFIKLKLDLWRMLATLSSQLVTDSIMLPIHVALCGSSTCWGW